MSAEPARFERNAKTNHFICNVVFVFFSMHLHVCAKFTRILFVYGQAHHENTEKLSSQWSKEECHHIFGLYIYKLKLCEKLHPERVVIHVFQVCRRKHAESLLFIDSQKNMNLWFNWFPAKAELALSELGNKKKTRTLPIVQTRSPTTTNKQQNDWEKKKKQLIKRLKANAKSKHATSTRSLWVPRSRLLAATLTECAFSLALTHSRHVIRVCFVWWCFFCGYRYAIRFTCRYSCYWSIVLLLLLLFSRLVPHRGCCCCCFTCWYYGRRFFSLLWIAWAL